MKRRIVALVMAITMAVTFLPVSVFAAGNVWDGRTSEEFGGGSGTEENPYLIENGAQLYYLSLQAESADNTTQGKYYALKEDIDLSGVPFPPIKHFRGILDGNGYTIKGLKISTTGHAGLILYGYDGSVVKNLILRGSITGKNVASAFVVNGPTKLENLTNFCDVYGEVYAAGFLGTGEGELERLTNYGNITCPSGYAAGILGYSVSRNNEIENCRNYGTINGEHAGGIVGSIYYDDSRYATDSRRTSIIQCVNEGDIIASENAGGIIGHAYAYSDSNTYVATISMSECVNAGKVSSSKISSGLIGKSEAIDYRGRIIISDSYNIGALTGVSCCGLTYGDGYHTESGFFSLAFDSCYSVGRLTQTGSGGILSDTVPETSKCRLYYVYYHEGENPDAINHSLAVANDNLSMVIVGGYSGFDFTNVWTWDASRQYDYPILRSVGVVTAQCSHVLSSAVRENEIAATCKEVGTYDSVVYCSSCGEEVSRETKTIAKLTNHTPGAISRENEVPATCKAAGSYDEVTRCTVCEKELTRVSKEVAKLLTHTPGAAATETTPQICTVCGSELVPALGTDNVVYILSFETSGGSVINPLSVTEGTTVNLSQYIPVKEGYAFAGWYSNQALTSSVTNVTVNADIKVYAKWENQAFTLTFQTNGGSSISALPVAHGTTVNLGVYTPVRAGYTFDGWYTDSSLSQKITSVTLTEDTTVYAKWSEVLIPEELPFTDVSMVDWFYNDVKYVYKNGMMNGVGANLFGPVGTTTRGMIVTILYRLEGEPTGYINSGFSDVTSGAYYAKAVAWAAANGVVNGTSPTTFAPNNPITREQMAAILYRYAQYKDYDTSGRAVLTKFSDNAKVSSYAVDALSWANAEGLINGVGADLLNPSGQASRCQVAAILHRFCTTVAE